MPTQTQNDGSNIAVKDAAQFTLGLNGSFNTSGGATYGTYTLATGTAHQVSATKDTMIYFIATHAGKLTLAMGPTSTPSHKLFGTAATVVIGSAFCVRVPAGSYVKPTFATSAAFTAVIVISC